MTAYRLSARAVRDLEELYAESAQGFGVSHADRYFEGLEATLEFLATHPMSVRERLEYGRPVRIHPYKAHVIIYRIAPYGIFVQRLRHGRSNWRSSPQST